MAYRSGVRSRTRRRAGVATSTCRQLALSSGSRSLRRVAPERPGAVLAAAAHRVDDGDPPVANAVPVQRGEQQRRGAAAAEQREVDVERRGIGHPHHAVTPSRLAARRVPQAGAAGRPQDPGRDRRADAGPSTPADRLDRRRHTSPSSQGRQPDRSGHRSEHRGRAGRPGLSAALPAFGWTRDGNEGFSFSPDRGPNPPSVGHTGASHGVGHPNDVPRSQRTKSEGRRV